MYYIYRVDGKDECVEVHKSYFQKHLQEALITIINGFADRIAFVDFEDGISCLAEVYRWGSEIITKIYEKKIID